MNTDSKKELTIEEIAEEWKNFKGLKHSIPVKYFDYLYLREIDLHPEKLGECPPFPMEEWQCEEFLKQGFLFKTREEAEKVRSVMVNAYLNTSSTSAVHS